MKKLTKDRFIEKSINIHRDKYDYVLVDYKNTLTKVKIICPKHGVFEQTPGNHYSGKGCKLCVGNVSLKNSGFVKKSKKIHGDKYDYSNVEYKNNRTNVEIICPEHGCFLQLPTHHMKGSGCVECACKKRGENNSKELSEFIKDSKKIHRDKYEYSKVIYKTNKIKVKIICSKHGLFKQRPDHHLMGSGCPVCRESKGEREISKLLKDGGVNFESQKKFDNCKYISKLSFDFYLPKHNLCIEYNGRQHYEPIDYFGGEKTFELQKKRDESKEKFCKENKIELLIIKYDELIENVINDIICKGGRS
jgi:very-short-patch-repair endonuclease